MELNDIAAAHARAAGSLKGYAVLPTHFSLCARTTLGQAAVCAMLATGILCSLPALAQDKPSRGAAGIDLPTQFLEKLRERGWHDVALEYLERADEDPLATPDFLAEIEFQLAVTRSALARQAVGDKQRNALLEQATAGYRKFADAHPDSPNSIEALSQVGSLLAERALVALDKADRLPEDATTEKSKLRDTARSTIDEAILAVERLLANVEKQLAGLPRGAALQANKQAGAFKQDLLGKQAEGRFLAANLNFEKARTFTAGSAQHREALQAAAAGFQQLRKDYENKLVGFYAVLYEGRCYQNAGDYAKALATFDELVNQPVGQADFRKLVARAYRYRAECHLAEKNFDKVIEECREWLDQSQSDELAQPEWLAVTYRLAEAYAQKAASDATAGGAGRLRTEARKLFREVSRQPGEFQNDARAALAISGSGTAPVATVTGFADALAAGKTALEQMTSAQLAVKLAANNNPAGVDDLQDQVAANRSAALKYFEQAVEFIDDKTPADEVAQARYYLCWLYWEDGRTDEAAALGEQIVEQHSESPYATTAAKVTLASYEKMYLAARDAGNANDIAATSAKLRQIAELIVDRWNDSDVATTATNLLISLALRENDYDAADQLLKKLPERARGAAGLTLGAALWNQYLQQAADTEGGPTAVPHELKSRATQLLAAGYESLSGTDAPTTSQATGVLYYVQALLAKGDAARALEVLEDKRVGPLAVMKRDSAGPHAAAFALEACKAALRTYVSVDPPRADDAIAMMEQLETIAGESEKSQQQLTSIYVSLGLQLQDQIKQLTADGNDAQAQGVAEAFASLLERVAQRGDSQSWAVRNWLAQTSLQLGSGLSGPAAARYLQQAESAYRNILNTVEKDPQFAPNELAILAVRMKLGETLQSQGKFSGAIEQFAAILAEKPNMLEVQQTAAAALQAWGNAQKDPAILERAIRGTNPGADGKNMVWGWLHLARVADYAKRSNPDQQTAAKYEDIYFGARFQAAKARYSAALLAEGDSRAKQLATVRQSIVALRQLYPDLGGARWKPKFDALLTEAGQ